MANICRGLRKNFFFSSPQVTHPYRIYWCKKMGRKSHTWAPLNEWNPVFNWTKIFLKPNFVILMKWLNKTARATGLFRSEVLIIFLVNAANSCSIPVETVTVFIKPDTTLASFLTIFFVQHLISWRTKSRKYFFFFQIQKKYFQKRKWKIN